MDQNGRELVEKSHREAVQQFQEQDQRQRVLVEDVHHESEGLFRQQPAAPGEGGTIHHTDLPAARPDDPLFLEWTYYRREVGRLLRAGQEGRWVLIKGEEILGIWNSEVEAEAAGLQRFPQQPFLIQQVRMCEPLLRGPSVLWRCPS